MLKRLRANTHRDNAVISARGATEYLDISTNAFSRAMAAGWIQPQAAIKGEGRRPAFGFEIDYLDELDKILPPKKVRQKGKVLFTDDVIAKVEQINKKWPTR